MNSIHAPFTLEGETAGQAIHATIGMVPNHDPITPNTNSAKTAGQAIHAPNHAIHGVGNHETHHPFRGGVSDAGKGPYIRRRALIIGAQTNETSQRSSVSVRCPYCRGVHQHAWGRADYAAPWCGTPGAVYQLVWPEEPQTTHQDELT